MPRSIESERGAGRPHLHVVNATSKTFRDVVDKMIQGEVVKKTVLLVQVNKKPKSDQHTNEEVTELQQEALSRT